MKTEETSLVDQSSKEIVEVSGGNKKNSKPKRKKNKRTMPNSVIQMLFETCKDVFAGGEAGYVPPPAYIERLCLALDSMRPEDVNLSPEMPYFEAKDDTEETPPISYLHIFDCPKFSIGIFCLPRQGVIPLHNHPGMTVFSKLLFGSMHVKSYDWVEPAVNLLRSQRLAKVHMDSEFTAPCRTSVLYPAAGGNLHQFRALTPCAMLDVLGPPYSGPEGRDCTYYRDFPCSSAFPGMLSEEDDKQNHAWLEERRMPEDFVLLGEMYRGPRILEN